MQLAKEIYSLTKLFPKEERYGLTSQIRRASVSIPSNIAEGCGRKTQKEFLHFLHNSFGSLKELECQLMLSRDLNFIPAEKFNNTNPTIKSLSRLMSSLMIKVRNDISND